MFVTYPVSFFFFFLHLLFEYMGCFFCFVFPGAVLETIPRGYSMTTSWRPGNVAALLPGLPLREKLVGNARQAEFYVQVNKHLRSPLCLRF